jgi:hypothetical protein
MKKLVSLMCLIAVLAACPSGDDDDSTNMMGSGTGGTGTGGMMAGTGGMMGTSGMGGGNGLTGACADADISAGGPALHMAAAAVLTPASPCGFSSCHTGAGKAKLTLMGSTDLKTLLVDKPSCEAPTLPLISSMGNEAGLEHSWIWQKLTAMTDTSGVGTIVSKPEWGMSASCGQDGDKPFGIRMPWTNSDMMLDATKLASIKAWICAGAPGPQ